MKLLVPKRRLVTRQRSGWSGRLDVTPRSYSKFDDATGQMYIETTSAVQSSNDRGWTRQSHVTDRSWADVEYLKAWRTGVSEEDVETCHGMKRSRIRGFKGARSLQDCAVECVLENISDVTQEGIECLPTHIVQRLWNEVNKRYLVSLDTWCMFSKILHFDTSAWNIFRYRQAIELPSSPLHIYINPLVSKSFDFLASLTITTSFPVPDLMKLPGLTNLGTLEIINTQGYENDAVSDRLIRAWHLAALNDGAFAVLRILKLWNHENVTSKSLSFVNSFISLAVYDVRGCGFDSEGKIEARRLGWQPTVDNDILGLFRAACSERTAVMRTSLGSEASIAKDTDGADSEQLWDGATVRRMPRSEVPTFLARSDSNTHAKPAVETEASRTEVQSPQRPQPKARFRDISLTMHSKQLLSKIQGSESWDLSNYKIFARIGELRNDTDLARAGVPIGDQAVVGNELVNSVPMVSLCLGQTPSLLENFSTNSSNKCFSNNGYSSSPISSLEYEWKEKPGLGTSTLRGLCFIRVKARLPSDSSPSKRSPGHEPKATQTTAPPKRHVLAVARNKKRKLDDVLSSFM